MEGHGYHECAGICRGHEYHQCLRGRPAFTTQPDTLENYDWQDIMLRNAVMQNYDLSVSGGNEVSTYFVSTNYQQQQGILRNSDYERINFRINSEHKLSKLFKVGENVQFTKAKHMGEMNGFITMSTIHPYWESSLWFHTSLPMMKTETGQ